jgi:hypothetical protein
LLISVDTNPQANKQPVSIKAICLHNSTYLHFTEVRGKDYSFVKIYTVYKEWCLFTAMQASPCKGYSYLSEVTGILYIRLSFNDKSSVHVSAVSLLGFLFVHLSVYLSMLSVLTLYTYIVHDRMINGYGAAGGRRLGRGNKSTRRKPAPVPLFPPQTPHYLTLL